MPTPPKPFFGVERSRKQVMCRSGLPGPGQCFAIKFGAAGEAAAVKKAEAWLQRELHKVKSSDQCIHTRIIAISLRARAHRFISGCASLR